MKECREEGGNNNWKDLTEDGEKLERVPVICSLGSCTLFVDSRTGELS